jgi:hypothetical protein
LKGRLVFEMVVRHGPLPITLPSNVSQLRQLCPTERAVKWQ